MFKEKNVLITGASRGIGKLIALEFAKEGANIGLNDVVDNEFVSETIEEIKQLGGNAVFLKADVSNLSEVKDMVKLFEKEFGGVDILINNAGITKDNLLIRMKEDEWDAVLNINLKGTFNCIQAAAKGMMKKRYGKIINISSIVGFSGNPGQANYVASKSGVMGLTKTAALELAARGIRVNAVAPGFIDTEMTKKLPEEVKTAMKNKIALGTFGQPEDVAKAVKFLASPDSDYITGQVIHVNGGMYM
jgi:3-oxoacyl-[acyl-carrier protein] reductase